VSSLWFQAVAGLRGLPEDIRWRGYVQAHERTVRAAQLRHISEQNGALGSPMRSAGTMRAQSLNGVVVATHGLEESEGRSYRWTEPVALLRLEPPEGGAVLRIDTGGIRGDPASYLSGVYAGRHKLAPELISSEGDVLELRLSPEFSRAAADRGIVVMSTPLVPSRNGSSDDRRLGMPVTRIELSPA
jgi:hypothetical protein